MNEKLEPLEKADGGFSRPTNLPLSCFAHACIMFSAPGILSLLCYTQVFTWTILGKVASV